MNNSEDRESGFIGMPEESSYVDSVMRDIEVLRITKTNVIARGRRYGRLWFIKALREELRDSVTMRKQLLKEFEIHSRLRHPAVVQAVGLENIDGLGLCIVEEWVEGITLREALQNGNINSSERRRIIHDIVKAISYLHSRGIVHRDLKPSNVMIRDIGREIVIIDFGLADTADYVEIKAPAGTPGFISPEQMHSGGAEPADDVYSLGVIMAELTPGYSAISRRCIKPLSERPADASNLLKLLDRRARRPKILMTAMIVIAIGFLVAFAIMRISSLERAARDSDIKMAELNIRNADNISLVSALKDSLSTMQGNLDNAKDELAKISRYENLKQSTLKEGYRLVDNALARADKDVFSKITPEDAYKYTDKIIELTNKLTSAIDTYCTARQSSSLQREDLEKIRADLYNYVGVKLSEYQNTWLKRINPLK